MTSPPVTLPSTSKRIDWKFSWFGNWPAVLFFLSSLFVFYFLSNHVFDPDQRKLEFAYPTVFSGDEPHYLVMISSILFDGDLSLANNYQSVRMGGIDAGRRFRGASLDHHTLIKDVHTGQSVLWEKVFDYKNTVTCVPSDLSCIGFKRIDNQFPDFTPANPGYVELPKHPIPFPAILAFSLRLLHTPADALEAHSIYLIILLSWLTGIITYLCCLDLGLSKQSSLVVVSLLFFASPWLMYSHSMVPATFMGLLLVAAFWALIKKEFAVSAALVAVATMQSEAFVLILPAWVLLLYFSHERKSAYRFAVASAVSIAIAGLINIHFIGHLTIRDMSFDFKPALLLRTFIDPGRGVFLFMPWCLPVLCFLIAPFFVHRRAGGDTLRVIAAGIFPVAGVYMILPNPGGYCWGPRYWVPFIPWLALALVLSLKMYEVAYRPVIRSTLIGLVALSAVFVVTASILPPDRVWQQVPWRSITLLLQSGPRLASLP